MEDVSKSLKSAELYAGFKAGDLALISNCFVGDSVAPSYFYSRSKAPMIKISSRLISLNLSSQVSQAFNKTACTVTLKTRSLVR